MAHQHWLYFGVPLLVKIAAINRLMKASRQMRRVVLKRRSLYGAVAGISTLIMVFLLVWTLLDPPDIAVDYILTDEVTEGATVVKYTLYCSSDTEAWQFAAVSWNAILLLCATVLAFQARSTRKDLNESKTLVFLIYSHFLFAMARVITFVLPDSVNNTTLGEARSLIFCLDTILTIIIYFVPKLFAADEPCRVSSTFLSDLPRSVVDTSSATIFGIRPRLGLWLSSITMVSHHEQEQDAQSQGAVNLDAPTSTSLEQSPSIADQPSPNHDHTDESVEHQADNHCPHCGEAIDKDPLLGTTSSAATV
jgi:hypothetical protein